MTHDEPTIVTAVTLEQVLEDRKLQFTLDLIEKEIVTDAGGREMPDDSLPSVGQLAKMLGCGPKRVNKSLEKIRTPPRPVSDSDHIIYRVTLSEVYSTKLGTLMRDRIECAIILYVYFYTGGRPYVTRLLLGNLRWERLRRALATLPPNMERGKTGNLLPERTI